MTDAEGALVEMPTALANGPWKDSVGTSSHSQGATETTFSIRLLPCQPVHVTEVWPLPNTQFFPNGVPVGSSAQNGSALKREFSGGSYNTKRQPMPSPSEGSLSSGGMDQGSDAPARDYDGEVSVL